MSANNFKLTLDTIAPNSCAVYNNGSENTTKNIQTTITITYDNPNSTTGNALYMKTWTDTHDPSWYEAAANASSVATIVEGKPWISYTATKVFDYSLESDAVYYVHAIFLDDVGNQTAIKHTGIIRVDRAAPSVSATVEDKDSHSHDYTNDMTFSITINAQDTGSIISGLDYVTIQCDDINLGEPITIPASSFSSNAYTRDLTFDSGTSDGLKEIYVRAYDKSGNVGKIVNSSDVEVPIQIYLDTAIAEASLLLKNSAGTATLNPYVKTTGFTAVINTTDTDIVAYKIWGDISTTGYGSTEPSDWTTWSPAGATSLTVSGLDFTTGNGTKTIHAKVKDSAGNTDETNIETRVYDASVPAITLTVSGAVSVNSQNWIAAGAGTTNQCTINYTATDSPAGISSITFTCQNANAGSASTITGVDGGSFTFKQKDLSGGTPGADLGANTITMTVVDRAGNSNTASVVVYIEGAFSLSASSPVVLTNYALLPYYYNATSYANANITVSMTNAPASGRATTVVKAWTDTITGTTGYDPTYSSTTWGTSGETLTIAHNSIGGINAVTNSNSNYMHVRAISAVGNYADAYLQYSYDTDAPTFSIVHNLPSDASTGHGTAAHTNQRTIVVTLSNVVDPNALGNEYQMQITSPYALETGGTSWTTITTGDRTITLASSNVSGDKSVTYTLRDKAGNTHSETITWEYDATAPQGTVTAKETDGSTSKENPTANRAFKALIAWTSDATDTPATIKYRIYGDINTVSDASASGAGTGIAQSSATWVTMSSASVVTDTYYLTTNTGTFGTEGVDKYIRVDLMDDAGNITTLNPAIVRLNTNAATLTIRQNSITHNRISCTHVLRKKVSSGTVVDSDDYSGNDYADIMSFIVDSDQQIVEWKVAAFKDPSVYPSATNKYPDADTQGSAVTAITKLSGSYSPGYSASGLDNITSWTVVVDGKDYRNAIAQGWVDGTSEEGSADGIHYIVVFAKNRANVWSVAGTRVTD